MSVVLPVSGFALVAGQAEHPPPQSLYLVGQRSPLVEQPDQFPFDLAAERPDVFFVKAPTADPRGREGDSLDRVRGQPVVGS
jgi:hypothetical protein